MLPLASVLPQFGPLPEPALAALLGLTTVATTLNINGAELFNAALLTVGWDPAAVSEALPGTAAFLAILGERLGWCTGVLSGSCCCEQPVAAGAACGAMPASGDRCPRGCTTPPRRAAQLRPSLPLATLAIPRTPRYPRYPRYPHAALHELGHWQAAGKRGVELAPSLFIPAGLGLLGRWGGAPLG